MKTVVRPVTPDTVEDFVTLFSARGSPHYCWCTPYRFRNAHTLSSDEKRDAMTDLVARDVPVGVLAYVDGKPAGWCSVAPRQTYVKLGRSRTMPRMGDEETWAILCLFVPRPLRGEGLAVPLLKGAVKYASEHGAHVVEAWPFDVAGISSTHRGHSAAYEKAGFELDGKRMVVRVR